jgi:hypothetical protein
VRVFYTELERHSQRSRKEHNRKFCIFWKRYVFREKWHPPSSGFSGLKITSTKSQKSVLRDQQLTLYWITYKKYEQKKFNLKFELRASYCLTGISSTGHLPIANIQLKKVLLAKFGNLVLLSCVNCAKLSSNASQRLYISSIEGSVIGNRISLCVSVKDVS